MIRKIRNFVLKALAYTVTGIVALWALAFGVVWVVTYLTM